MSTAPSRRPDPLLDVLLTPTVDGPAQRSVTRSRAGNAMARSRAAILAGAGRALLVSGTQISMTQVAAASGVAKATLYNHFRTRDDVLQALLLAEVEDLIVQLAPLELADALIQAAMAISEHPMLEALGAEDLGLLSSLARVDVRLTGWRRAAEAVDALLTRSGRRGAPTVLRWLASFITAPADVADIRADVDVLVAGLPPILI